MKRNGKPGRKAQTLSADHIEAQVVGDGVPAQQAPVPEKHAGFQPGNEHGTATRFKPGESGNPAGRRPAGMSVREWVNQMTDRPVEQLRAIDAAPDPHPWSKVIAARWLLRSGSNDLSKGGFPIAEKSLAELFDRTVGKAPQQVEIKAEHRHLHLIDLTSTALAALDEAIGPSTDDSALLAAALDLPMPDALPAAAEKEIEKFNKGC